MAASTAVTMTPLAGTRFVLSVDHSWWPGHRAVAAEGEQHPGRAGLAGRRAEELAGGGDQQDDRRPTWSSCAWVKMVTTAPPPADTPSESCTANRKVSSRIQPPIAE